MSRRKRSALMCVAGALLTSPLLMATESSAVPLPLVGYQIHTVDAGSRETYVDAVFGVPTPVDVTGDRQPDVVVELVGVPSTVGPVTLPLLGTLGGPVKIPLLETSGRLVITRLVPSLRALVEVSVANGDSRARFGFDGRDVGTPTVFDASFVIVERDEETGFSAALSIVGAPGSLKILGEESTAAAAGGRPNRTYVEVDFSSPVPRSITVWVLPSASRPQLEKEVHIETDTHTTIKVEGALDDVKAGMGSVTTFNAEIRRVQRSMTLRLLDDGVRSEMVYDAAGPVDFIGLEMTVAGVHRPPMLRHTVMQAWGVDTTRVSFVQEPSPWFPGQDQLSVRSNGRIDRIDIGLGENSRVTLPTVDPAREYVHRTELMAGASTTTARVRGLREATINLGDTLTVDLQHDQSPLDVILRNGTKTTTIGVFDVPPTAFFKWAASTRTLHYNGSGGIARVAMQIDNDGQPLFQSLPVKDLRLDVRGIPSQLDAAFRIAPDGTTFEGITLDARPGRIDWISVSLVSNRLGLPFPGDWQGLFVDDQTTQVPVGIGLFPQIVERRDFHLEARMSDVEFLNADLRQRCEGQVSLTTAERCDVTVDTRLIKLPTKEFRVYLRDKPVRQSQPANTDITLTDLPRDVTARFTQRTSTRLYDLFGNVIESTSTDEQSLSYTSPDPGLVVRVERDEARDREFTDIWTSPLPAGTTTFCKAADGRCLTTPEHQSNYRRGSLRASAAGPVTLNLRSCVRRASGRSGCEESLTVQDLDFTYLAFGEGSRDRGAETGYFFDTNDFVATGRISMIDAGADPNLEIYLHPGFRAQDRWFWYRLDLVPTGLDAGGNISCPEIAPGFPHTLVTWGVFDLTRLACYL